MLIVRIILSIFALFIACFLKYSILIIIVIIACFCYLYYENNFTHVFCFLFWGSKKLRLLYL